MKADIEAQVNDYSQLVTVEVTGALTNFPYKNLIGGAKGTSPASWATYFDTIKKEFSDVLVVLSSNQAIQAEAITHLLQMESRGQKQVLFSGGGVDETVDTVKQRAVMFNSSRAVVGYPSIFCKLVDDGKTALPCYMTAAMIAGRACGVDPTEPLTFEYFNIVSLKDNLIVGDPVIDDLITSGVATLERVQNGGIRLAESITTYLGSSNTLYRELSVRRGADKLSTRVTKKLEDLFVGKKNTITTTTVTTAAIDELEQAVKDNDIKAYDPKSVTVRYVGTAIYVDYRVAPASPVNFVLVTSHFVPEI
jgi:hypothetical protein